jgi:DNA-binding transcriptional LysR family regulator
MARTRLRRYFRHGLIPQLMAFEACVRLGGVTRAADELALAQPTVSGLLKRLSDLVGEPVLRTRGGRVELTEAGREVQRLCEEVLGSLNRFEERRSENVRAETNENRAWSHAPGPLFPSKSPPASRAS